MLNRNGIIMVTAISLATSFAFGGGMIVYPNKKQGAKQQEKDTYECSQWAKQQLGYDPEMLLQTSQSSATQAPPQGGLVRGGAKGAVLGTVGGAIGGDVGKGAAIGAGVGALGGAARRAKSEAAQQQAQAQQKASTDQKLASFHKAEGACLTGRGYTVTQ